MSCANHPTSTLVAMPLPAPAGWMRPRPLTALGAIVDAFREALELRRAAHRIAPLDDE